MKVAAVLILIATFNIGRAGPSDEEPSEPSQTSEKQIFQSEEPPAWYVQFRDGYPEPHINHSQHSTYRVASYDMTSHVLYGGYLPSLRPTDQQLWWGWTKTILIWVGCISLFAVASRVVYRFNLHGQSSEENWLQQRKEDDEQNEIWRGAKEV